MLCLDIFKCARWVCVCVSGFDDETGGYKYSKCSDLSTYANEQIFITHWLDVTVYNNNTNN